MYIQLKVVYSDMYKILNLSQMKHFVLQVLVILVIITSICPNSVAQDTLPGPIEAKVLKVIDGDTIEIKAKIWLGQDIVTKVRVEGIDTPELRRSKCQLEKEMAQAAKEALINFLAGQKVTLRNIKNGKYAGRVVAEVYNFQDLSVSDFLIGANLAHSYQGKKRTGWC